MSTYVSRYIEVKRPIYDYSINTIDDLGAIENPVQGAVCHIKNRYTENNKERYLYFVFQDNKWNGRHYSTKYEWKLFKWYAIAGRYSGEDSENAKRITLPNGKTTIVYEITHLCNNGGAMRDEYYTDNRYFNKGLGGRGFPDDISQELKTILENDFNKYSVEGRDWRWNKSYALLSELVDILEKEKEEYKKKQKEILDNIRLKSIEEKLNDIYNVCKNNNYTPIIKEKEDEDDIFYEVEELEEKSIDIEQLNNEIQWFMGLVEETYGYVSSKDIRIVYYYH